MIDDTTALESIRRFIQAEKPAGVTAIDILQIVHLLSKKAPDHPVYDSQLTLSQYFGCDIQTTRRSQDRLSKLGWLARPQRRGKTNALSLLYQNIPSQEIIRRKITPQAKQLAFAYKQALQGRKRFPKGWLDQQHLSAQRILELCSGDERLAATLIDFACLHPTFGKRSRQSLYQLLRLWKKITASYSEHLQRQERRRQAAEAVQRTEEEPA